MRDHRRRAFSAYAVGVGWIIFLFYVFLGIASFWPQLGVHADPAAAAGYVVVFLFMLVPLDGLLNNLPTVNAARVSLTRIEGVMAEFGALRTVPPASDAPTCRRPAPSRCAASRMRTSTNATSGCSASGRST